MITSMTGFASRKFQCQAFDLQVAIKSFNHRFLDWSYRGTQISRIENQLRAICQKELHRGRIEVFCDVSFSDPARWEFRINEDLLSNIFEKIAQLSSRTDKEISLSIESLFAIPHVTELKRRDFAPEEEKFLEDSFRVTLEELKKYRRKEGLSLTREIREHLRLVKKSAKQIDRLSKSQPQRIQEKLRDRLLELARDASISEEKMITESAFMSQRYDLSEEVERMKVHVAHFERLLSSKIAEPVGKKLDFISQELFREVNTINSKAQDLDIVEEGLVVKGELESIRQQLQNIE